MDCTMNMDRPDYTSRSAPPDNASSSMDLGFSAVARHDSIIDARPLSAPKGDSHHLYQLPLEPINDSPLCSNEMERQWHYRHPSPEANPSFLNAVDSAPTHWTMPSPPQSEMGMGSMHMPAIDATISGALPITTSVPFGGMNAIGGYDFRQSTSIAEEMPMGSLANTQFGSFGFDNATFGSFSAFDGSFRPGSHMASHIEYNTPPSAFAQNMDSRSEPMPIFQRQRITNRPTSQIAMLRNSMSSNASGHEMTKGPHEHGGLPSPCSSYSQSFGMGRNGISDSQGSRPIQIQVSSLNSTVSAISDGPSSMSQASQSSRSFAYATPPTPGTSSSRKAKAYCWEHGCNGRVFSTSSNLLRHQREKDGTAIKAYCPGCGAQFTRTTARNGHFAHGKCTNRPRASTEVTTMES